MHIQFANVKRPLIFLWFNFQLFDCPENVALVNYEYLILLWDNRIIGAFGVGPKYLVDEYAVVDTRYWPLQDPCVTVISLTELLIMAPLCFFW